MPIIIFIGLLRNTSRSLGIIGAKMPNTMQASVLPSAHRRKGRIPLPCDIVIPLRREPAFAHVAAILIA